MSNFFRNFAANSILKGGVFRLLVAGFFYACTLQIHGVTPVRCVNAPAAFKVEFNGSVAPFFFRYQNKFNL